MRLAALGLSALLVLAACESAPPPPPPAPNPLAGLFPPVFDNLQHANYPEGSCLREDELQAELLARLRTEMMVTGLSCNGVVGTSGGIPYNEYVQFTVAHQERLRDSQDVLGRFLSRYESGSSARLFDTYITGMANDEAQSVLALTPARYCRARRDQFNTATRFNEAQLNEYLAEARARYSHVFPVCDSPAPQTAAAG